MTATWHKVKNNAASELASAITDAAIELTLKTGEGSRFPSGFPYRITIDDEIMAVTARTDDTLTVTRAQESTSPASHNGGAAVRLNITAALIEELQAEIDTKETTLPLTTKGDLLGFATALARLPVGSDGQYLVADSSEDAGIKWASLSGLTSISTGTYTGNGDSSRAIPHGLGVVPTIVFVLSSSNPAAPYRGRVFNIGTTSYLYSDYGSYVENPTAMNSTNFYVIESHYSRYNFFNHNSTNYYWVASAGL